MWYVMDVGYRSVTVLMDTHWDKHNYLHVLSTVHTWFQCACICYDIIKAYLLTYLLESIVLPHSRSVRWKKFLQRVIDYWRLWLQRLVVSDNRHNTSTQSRHAMHETRIVELLQRDTSRSAARMFDGLATFPGTSGWSCVHGTLFELDPNTVRLVTFEQQSTVCRPVRCMLMIIITFELSTCITVAVLWSRQQHNPPHTHMPCH